jgi:hypothetical protein
MLGRQSAPMTWRETQMGEHLSFIVAMPLPLLCRLAPSASIRWQMHIRRALTANDLRGRNQGTTSRCNCVTKKLLSYLRRKYLRLSHRKRHCSRRCLQFSHLGLSFPACSVMWKFILIVTWVTPHKSSILIWLVSFKRPAVSLKKS